MSASARPSFAASNFVSDGGKARFLLALALLLLGSLVFGVLRSSADAPAVTIEAASQVGFTTAKAKGTVNPGGKETSYHFEFTTQAQFEAEGWGGASWTAVESIATGTTAVPVEATLEGLASGTQYHLRLVAENEDSAGTPSEAEAPTFATDAATAPTLTASADSVAYTSAQISGTIDPQGGNVDPTQGALPIHWELQFTPDIAQSGWTTFEEGTIEGPAAESSDPIAVGPATTPTIDPSREYKYRLHATYAGTSADAEGSFETKTVTPPLVSADDATAVTGTSAHFSGEVTPGGTDGGFNATCRFEYVTDAGYQAHKEVQILLMRATGGTYALRFEGEETPTLAYDTGAAGVQSALEGLAAIGPGGVTVTPGDGGLSEEVLGGTLFSFEVTFSEPVNVPLIGPVSDFLEGPGSTFDRGKMMTLFQGHPEGFGVAQTIACQHGTPAGSSPVAGTSPVEVWADPNKLEPHTVYHLRLTAENLGGQKSDVASNFETEQAAPIVTPAFGSPAGPHTGVLVGSVNPRNSTATYQFEWGTDESYGNVTPASPAPLGFADNTSHRLSAQISGLQEGTTYHFRLVATNTETNEVTEGDDRTFTTPSAYVAPTCPNEARRAETNSLLLPDCRGYELVTPAVKDYPFGQLGAEIAVAAREGGAVAFGSFGPLPGAISGVQDNYNIARRGVESWTNTPVSPPQSPVPGKQTATTRWFSQDLSRMEIKSENPVLTPDAPPGVLNLYIRNTETGSYTLLTTTPGTPGQSPFAAFAGASDDSSHLVFESNDQLLPDAPHGGGVYELEGDQLRNVGIYPDGTPAAFATIGAGAAKRLVNAVSSDGRRVIWTDGGQLYDRIDHSTTIKLSASQRTIPDPSGPKRAAFWGASADGSKVFFTDLEALTDDAVPNSEVRENPDTGQIDFPAGNLYEYDFDTGDLTDLSLPASPSGPQADVRGVVGISDDGEYVYFVARGDLGGGAEAGGYNLYLSHAGETEYIGTLDFRDSATWEETFSSSSGQAGVPARVSADGSLAIQSFAPLTGYDNLEAETEKRTSQVYLYSPDSRSLICASCRADGTPPEGSSTITPSDFPDNPTRNLSDDGARLFFNSTDALVAGDTNGESDVYEWTQGRVHLISDGTSNSPAYFQDASADGNDVFFSSGARLVAQDIDEHRDLYDARVDGGFPRPPVVPGGCEGEGCRGAGSSAPNGSSAVTVNFAGPGNPQPKKGNAKARSKALKACRRAHKHDKHKRKRCESRVKKRFAKQTGRGK